MRMLVTFDLTAPGAAPEDLVRGIQAARDVFATSQIDPQFAANAAERERVARASGRPVAEYDRQGAAAFRFAEAAALEVVLGRGAERPAGAMLAIRLTH